jgi:acyl-CoA thioester hydrolase
MRSERYGGGRTEVDARASALAGTAITLRRVSEVFTHRLRVRYGECDPQGVVFNANYYAYFDLLITELWREAVGGYTAMLDAGADLSVVESKARFIASARFDDEIDLNATIARLGNTAMSTHIEITRAADQAKLVEGEIHHVFIDPATYTKRPIPDNIRAALEPYLGEPVEAPA